MRFNLTLAPLAALVLASALGLSACNSTDSSSSSSSSSSSTTDSTTTTRTWTDVAYASSSTAQKLDIYLPDSGVGIQPYPVVIWIHGGAFKFGDKANPQSLAALKAAGFAVVSVNYRLSGEAQWPAQLDDLRSIVTFLRTNASKYQLNPNKIGSWGASAGGHLSAMMGIALANDAATRIQAAVDWFGPIDFYNMDADIIASGVARCTGENGAANSPESALIGATVSENKAKSDAASPLSYLAALPTGTTLPPFFIVHGGLDCNIGAKQSERLHNAIVAKYGANQSTYTLYTGGTHGAGDFKEVYAEEAVVNFFTTHLK